MFFTKNLIDKISKIIDVAKSKNLKIVTAESCTGGLLAALFTEVSGSSKVLERGFVTYSNEAKNESLGVKKESLDLYGAVSAQVAEAMAQGALKNSCADIAIAITGIAGPDGGSQEKPVGLVYIAIANKNFTKVRKFYFSGNRTESRKSSLIEALQMIELCLNH